MKVLLLTFALMILVAASEGRRWPGMPGPGPCKAMFRRYKCVEGRCLEYIYGGCGPDGGGYRTMDQCERFCNGSFKCTACTRRRTISPKPAGASDSPIDDKRLLKDVVGQECQGPGLARLCSGATNAWRVAACLTFTEAAVLTVVAIVPWTSVNDSATVSDPHFLDDQDTQRRGDMLQIRYQDAEQIFRPLLRKEDSDFWRRQLLNVCQ
ncbi:putative secreted salivary protease inhibitor [Ixodes scapularis]